MTFILEQAKQYPFIYFLDIVNILICIDICYLFIRNHCVINDVKIWEVAYPNETKDQVMHAGKIYKKHIIIAVIDIVMNILMAGILAFIIPINDELAGVIIASVYIINAAVLIHSVWCRVTLNEILGMIHGMIAWYMEAENCGIDNDVQVFGKTLANINLRGGPSHKFDTIATIPKGTMLVLHDTDNPDWYRVSFYVCGKYIKKFCDLH